MASKMGLQDGVLKPICNMRGRLAQPGRNTTNNRVSLGSFRRAAETGMLNVGIIRSLGGIGDVLMTTPSLRAIKNEWPNCNITYGTDFNYANGALKGLLKNNPYIDSLVPYHIMSRGNFDTLIDITSCCVKYEKPGVKTLNRINLFANEIGVSLDNTGYKPDVILTPDEQHWAKQKIARIKTRGDQIIIGIQPSSSVDNRSWPLDKVRQLVILLSQNPLYKVVVFDWHKNNTPGEPWNFTSVTPIVNYDIRQVAALINKVDLMITPDSGLMHLAAAFNIPTLAIFGGTDPDARINLYPRTDAICSSHYACHPCWYNQKACNNTYTCMKSISVDQVFEKAIQLINNPNEIRKEIKSITTSEKVLLIRNKGGLGDILGITSAAASLKEKNKHLEVHVKVPDIYKCVFDYNPNITTCNSPTHQVIIKNQYNLTSVDAETEFDYISNRKQRVDLPSRFEIYINAVHGVQNSNTVIPSIFLQDEEKAWAKSRFLNEPKYKYIAVALNSAETYRSWPLESYLELFMLARKQYPSWRFVILSDKRTELELPDNTIDCTGFSIRRMFSIVHGSDAVLTPDTSVLHVAGAFKKPCVALFGPIDSKTRCKSYENTVVVSANHKDFACMPCWRNASIPCNHTSNKNTSGISYCMQSIKPIHILSSLEKKLCQKK